ncbi:chromogranin-A isoform X1 [Entelurus aequoreus]|uniref:chromogranin-A isoform X1 n=2 Tax=Entelurus aequoreus TaxID=161455 RepID=UPI002B1DE946|nr:chromogranin-A isoform X1 [Entelurus aequoreus]
MIALLTVTLLIKGVLTLPVTPHEPENCDDVKVMKCVVEALADVLSRPRPSPVSQECLQTLRTDERLLTLLRHYDFLKELHDIAPQGGEDRVKPPGGAIAPSHVTRAPLSLEDDVSDQSMLDALGGPGEQSILSQKRRMTGNEDAKEEEEEEKKGSEGLKSKEFNSEDEEEEDKRSDIFFSDHSEEKKSEEENEDEMKRSRMKSSGGEKQQEEHHHSKEMSEAEEVTKKKEMKMKKRNRTPEEKELQMIAQRGPEEEGSAVRKTEQEEDVERLAAIESDLENVAQKLHDLRRG